MRVTTHSFSVGDFDCLVIQDQATTMHLADLVAGVEPEELAVLARQLGLPPEGIDVGYNCLLVRTGEQNVLVDAGYGTSLEGREGALHQGLENAGITADQIDWIAITHADRDHIGGTLDEQGDYAYPNARYVMWQGAWDFWQDREATRDWPQQIVGLIRGTIHKLEPRLTLVSAGEEFLPGLQILPAVGHRHDHVVVKLSSRDECLLHLADALIHPIFVKRPDWASTYDSVPEQAVAAKKRLLDLAASERALVFGAHIPFPGLGYVKKEEMGWSWWPVAAAGP